MERKTRSYGGEGIVVRFEPARCIHAARCVNGLPEVFDPEARPWIQPGKASAEAVAEVVRRCPTGALTYGRSDGGEKEEIPTENTLRVIPDGPLYLAGAIRLETADGEVLEETRVALCRCGDSKHKPFCDNTHIEKKFTEPGVAVEHRLSPLDPDSSRSLTIRLAPDGPLLLEGPLQVLAGEEGEQGGKAALCRCGASATKPYCDGSHKQVAFKAD